MTRPEIIRADSIDLQDREAPSAQDHPRSTKPATSGGLLAPHQAETLREVAAESAEENLRSPRVSWTNGDAADVHQYADNLADGVANSLNGRGPNGKSKMQSGQQQQQDALAIAQNGGLSGQEADDGDLDAEDDGLDDDMMDKISSSPSIDDGGSTSALPSELPRRDVDCSDESESRRRQSPHPPDSDARSSSPYLEHPDHIPPPVSDQRTTSESVEVQSSHHHLHNGKSSKQSRPNLNSNSLANQWDNERQYSGLGWEEGEKARVVILTEVVAEMRRLEQAAGLEDIARLDSQAACPENSALGHRSEDQITKEDVDEGIGDIECGLDHYLTIPYDDSGEDDDDDFSDTLDSRFVDSGWGGDCLQDTEDIDFEFVYALHTFVATVEGQANATKGDTMVLLDDSNSYWWLVRVVKDSSIGYLPAEHIETPTERLARLNKHRNIDLSATMLSDQADKSRNPLKSAMKRRKTKTVTFTAPTYVDYSDFDYSSEEEDLEAQFLAHQQQQALQAQQEQQQQQQQQEAHQTQQNAASQAPAGSEMEDESARVEPLKPRGQQKDAVKVESANQEANGDIAASTTVKPPNRTSEETFESRSSGDGPKKTSDGTVRDSFFKDDTVETKKITLTPNLLRDDTTPKSSGESNALKQRPSLDKLDKDMILSKDDKKKKDKKEKDKKPSGIRNFFSRKDKKRTSEDDEFGVKRSMEMGNENEFDDDEAQAPIEKPGGPQRQTSKLQKPQPRTEPSPTRKPNGQPTPKDPGLDITAFLSEKGNNVSNVPPATMRIVDQNAQEATSPVKDEKSPTSKIPSRVQTDAARPQKVVKAKSRVELDDFDSSEEETANEPTRAATAPEESQTQPQKQPTLQRPSIPGAYPDSYLSTKTTSSVQTEKAITPAASIAPQQQPQAQPLQTQQRERLSESPVQVSPVTSDKPPPLMVDTSSQEEDHSSARSSPEMIEHEDRDTAHGKQDSITTTTTASTSGNAPVAWNDTGLRAFFDSGSDIRDLLVMVYDKTDVEPAGPEHPVVGTLFKEQNAKLAEITTQLDNMLGDWLARKQRMRGTV